jgi:hypothetical protein
MRSLLSVALLLLGLTPAVAQAPPAVPALPDTTRLTAYSITATKCVCSVGFALYGDGTDIDNWIQVWIGNTRYLSTDPTFGWSLSSPTGPIGTIPRPISDAVLTFNAVQTGTVQIVGARRPRRTSQFPENRGVAARDLNQVITDIVAQNREEWDKLSQLMAGLGWPPSKTGTTNTFVTASGAFTSGHCISFDGNGNLIDGGAPCVSASSGVSAGTINQLAFYAATGSTVAGLPFDTTLQISGGKLGVVPSIVTPTVGRGRAVLYLDTTNSPHAWDMFGNVLNICGGSVTNCLQEFINYTMLNMQPALATCYGSNIVQFTGTMVNGSKVITGISPTTGSLGLAPLNTVQTWNPSGSSSGIPPFTHISTVDSSTQITLTNAATVSQTIGMAASGGPNDPQSGIYYHLGASIIFPPMENQDFELNCNNATFNGTVLTSGFVFDSMMSSRVLLKAVIVYQPSSSCTCATILIQPRNPTFDGFITVGAGSFFASNPSTGANAEADVKFDLSNGGEVRNGRFIFDELLGGQNGIVVENAGATNTFAKNQIQASNIHGQNVNGISVGSNGTQTSYHFNTWQVAVEGVGSGAGICFHSWAQHDIIDMQCANANQGLQFQVGANNNEFRIQTDSVAIPFGDPGTSNIGYVNGVAYSNQLVGVTCAGVTAGTVTSQNGVITHC